LAIWFDITGFVIMVGKIASPSFYCRRLSVQHFIL